MESRYLFVLAVGIVLVSGCAQKTEYVCLDGSTVVSPDLCPTATTTTTSTTTSSSTTISTTTTTSTTTISTTTSIKPVISNVGGANMYSGNESESRSLVTENETWHEHCIIQNGDELCFRKAEY